MEMVPVESSAIEAIGYEAKEKELLVRFRSHETYAYLDAPKRTYEEFLHAESKGHYFAENVRPKFKYRKLQA